MKNVHTLGFEFCIYSFFKNCQPLAPCSFSSHKIARYVSPSVMLCLMCSSDIPTQTQGVTSICWDAMSKKRNRKNYQIDTAQSTPKTVYIPRTTVILDSLPSTDTIFVCFLLKIVPPSLISTRKARNIFTTCWTEHPLTEIRSPCIM